MKPKPAHSRLCLKGTLLAMLIAAVATPGTAGEPPATQLSAAIVPLSAERELLAWITGVLQGSPAPGSWALFLAGLAGVCAIAHRRVSAIGDHTLRPHRLRR